MEDLKNLPHVTSLHKDLQVEYKEAVVGQVTGSVPEWINGSWYRNGPGIIHFEKQTVNHWFDGMALAKRFLIQNGKVSYVSQLIEGQSKCKNVKAGKIVVSEFGTPATHQGLEKVIKMVTGPDLTDNCLINFMCAGRHLMAITEGNTAIQLDPNTLDTMKILDLSKYFPVHVMGSHPLHDVDQKLSWTFTSSILDHGHTKYHLVSIPGAKADLSTDLTCKQVLENCKVVNSINAASRFSPSYHHSFSMTRENAIFVEMPLRLDISSLATAHLVGKSCVDCMQVQENLQTTIHVVPKHKNKKHELTYQCEPMYIWHYVNTYEDDGHLVLELCAYKGADFHKKYYIDDLLLPPSEYAEKFRERSHRIIRMVLPLSKKPTAQVGDNLVELSWTSCTATLMKDNMVNLTSETICEGADFPVINENYRGLDYEFFYSPGGEYLPPGDMLCKVSTKTKRKTHEFKEKDCWFSQPCFIPNPEKSAEDQGILISSVNHANGNPFLLMLDAEDFTEVARVHFDANIPPDIHGVFISNE